MSVEITPLSMSDYDEAAALWAAMPEIGLDDADRRGKMASFLERNPGLSFVARHEGKLIGAVLCGHDGRRGYLHHLAVDPAYRKRGIGTALVSQCLLALASAGIERCNIFIYSDNKKGQDYWRRRGWSTYEGLSLMFKSTASSDLKKSQ